jgi:hypothetical protein
MNAEPILVQVAALLSKHKLDAVLIGNAAAALQGSPVSTVDLDFLFRDTKRNVEKVHSLAKDLHANVSQPFYPASGLYRVIRSRDALQLDFMTEMSGISSFESLRSRASVMRIGRRSLKVATLEDVIRSKTAANRPEDRAVLPILRQTLREKR